MDTLTSYANNYNSQISDAQSSQNKKSLLSKIAGGIAGAVGGFCVGGPVGAVIGAGVGVAAGSATNKVFSSETGGTLGGAAIGGLVAESHRKSVRLGRQCLGAWRYFGWWSYRWPYWQQDR